MTSIWRALWPGRILDLAGTAALGAGGGQYHSESSTDTEDCCSSSTRSARLVVVVVVVVAADDVTITGGVKAQTSRSTVNGISSTTAKVVDNMAEFCGPLTAN